MFLCNSCTYSSVSNMEELTGISLTGELTLSINDSHWNKFNGNGYRIDIYNVDKGFIQRKYSVFKSNGFNEYNSDSWTSSEIYPYIKKSHGIYKIYTKDNEVVYIFINIDNNTIICFLNIL